MTHSLRIDGIDLSHFQNQHLDYAKAKKAGVKFVYHKATEATTFRDPNYDERRAEAKQAGLRFGAYHFAQPSKTNAVAEAEWFLKVSKPVPGDMLPALDLEVNPHNLSRAELTGWAVSWWATVHHALGIKNGVTYTHFNLSHTSGSYLWVPRYSTSNALPEVPKPWKRYSIRQFSDGRTGVPNKVPGVGHCDIDHIRNGFLGLHRVGWKKRLTIPHPKPGRHKKRHVKHRVSQFNVEFGHKPVGAWADMILDRFETLKIDVQALSEIEDYFAVLKQKAEARGHTLLGHGEHSRNALLVRNGHKTGNVRTVPGSVHTWFNPHGHPMSMPTPVVATVDGITYVAIHAPVTAWTVGKHGWSLDGPDRRVQAYKDFTYNLVKFLQDTKGNVVVLGDWNVSPSTTGTYSADWVRQQTHTVWVRPHANTGHGEIDFGIARGAKKVGKGHVIPQTEFLVKGEHSDHMQVWWDLEF